MGTNYYFHEPDRDHCQHCGRYSKGRETHIGKSSHGWCFSLHATDELRSIEDWMRKFDGPGHIEDEYGEVVGRLEMIRIITERSMPEPPNPTAQGYSSLRHMLDSNHAELGPNNLLRHRPRDGVWPGPGTWDMHEGVFF